MGTEPKRIGIIGMGGVGGYYGGMLARAAETDPAAEVIFIMRGKARDIVAAGGLRLTTPGEEFVAHPALASDRPEDIGRLDLLLFCTKGYDLETAARQYSACIPQGAIVLPLLNGVENTGLLQQLLPQATVWKGCTYIISKIEAPGHIVERGNFNELHFGAAPGGEQPVWFTALLDKAGIRYSGSGDIDLVIWKKFLLVCAIGTLTSYLDRPVGYLLEHPEHKDTLVALMKEIAGFAQASGIDLGPGVIETTLAKMATLPYETTSSMQADFSRQGRTELESLTGYVVRASAALGLQAPVHERIYGELKKRVPAG